MDPVVSKQLALLAFWSDSMMLVQGACCQLSAGQTREMRWSKAVAKTQWAEAEDRLPTIGDSSYLKNVNFIPRSLDPLASGGWGGVLGHKIKSDIGLGKP